MCLNGRFIYNRYSGQNVFVRCGHCEACKQEDALKRTNRIRLNMRHGFIWLFVTLTYTNDFVPYVLRSELNSDDFDINVYRRCSGRYVYSNKNGLRFKKSLGIEILERRFIDTEFRYNAENNKLKSLNGMSSDCIGVCYYPDLQNFFKRLRENYEREFNERLYFDSFQCAEYGGYSYRPHFHILLAIPSSCETKVRSAIVKSWPYADRCRTAKFIEVARDAASYVASYVNSSISLSSCLSHPAYKQKHSQSQNLGVAMDCFRITDLLEKIDKRDLHYYFEKKFDGESSVTPCLVPKYIINRYFPKFKGLHWFTIDALRCILLEPQRLFEYVGNYSQEIKIDYYYDEVLYDGSSRLHHVGYSFAGRIDLPFHRCYDFSLVEVYKIAVRLWHAQLYFMSETGLNAYDFAHYYISVWNLYDSTLLSDSFRGIKTFEDYSEFYFNSNDFVHDVVHSPTLDGLEMNPNPNSFHDLVLKSSNLKKTYLLKDKTKKVINYSMSSLGYEV